MKSLKNIILSFLAIKLFQPFYEWLHYVSLKGMNYGSANDPKDSGELSLLKLLSKEMSKNPIVFDVGSNNGQYLGLLLDVFKDLHPIVHCFEPNLIAFEKLQKKYGNRTDVVLNNVALGDSVINSTLYSSKVGDVQSSMIATGNNQNIKEEVKILTLDYYCEEYKINEIDFLKIDTEGYETHVLKGAKKMIVNKKINRIQLEHGSIQSIIAQASLFNYKKMLPYFNVFHIKQNGIRKIKYTTRFEIYYNSNYYFKLKP